MKTIRIDLNEVGLVASGEVLPSRFGVYVEAVKGRKEFSHLGLPFFLWENEEFVNGRALVWFEMSLGYGDGSPNCLKCIDGDSVVIVEFSTNVELVEFIVKNKMQWLAPVVERPFYYDENEGKKF